MNDTTPDDEIEPETIDPDEGGGDDAAGSGITGAIADRARGLLGREQEPGHRIVDAATGDEGGSEPGGPPPERDHVTGSESGDTPVTGSSTRRRLVDAATGIVGGASGAIRDAAGDSSQSDAAAGGAGSPGGAGGGGSFGGGGNGDGGDDDEALFPGVPISATNQVIWLGLLVAAVLLFGASLWSALFGDDDGDDPGSNVATAQTAGDEETVAIADSSAGMREDSADSSDESSSAAPATTTTVETTTTIASTTTEAPATTQAETSEPETSEAETTTTATSRDAFTMWDALNETGQTDEFAKLGGALGLDASLEDPGVDRTLFAPSDAALDAVDSTVLNEAASDPEGAGAALVGYHFVDERLLASDLAELDGQQLTSSSGLPIVISIVDGAVVLNGTTRIVDADFESDNGVVHVVDLVLAPPTVNEVLGLENIEFEAGSAVITARGQDELAKAVEYFGANPELTASIQGHTDTDGPEEQNLALSEDRAAAVKEFLVGNGLDGDRFTTAGFGETRPIVIDGVEDKAASRRIEFVIG